jgi:hypothetical protein
MRNLLTGLLTICAIIGLILGMNGVAKATWYEFWFSEEDLWEHTPTNDSALYDQDAPRRHHTAWKSDVQTTDSAQPNQSEYNRSLGMGTNGWKQTATYDSWLSGGPLDNDDNPFGIADVQLWGANFPNSKYAWGERFKLADTGINAWQILQTPTGWTGEIIENPWPDPGFTNNMYFVDWYADDYNNRILYDKYGDGQEDYLFGFKVDIAGEYPSYPEETPLDGNPFEDDGSLRIWFGGYTLNSCNEWTNEGFDGVMELEPIPEPGTMLLLGFGLLGLAGYTIRRKKKNS